MDSVDVGSESHPSSVTTDSGARQPAIARFLDDPGDPNNWRWLCKAAAEGNSAAQYTVGVRYRDGLTQSIPEAARKSLRTDKKPPTEADCARTGG